MSRLGVLKCTDFACARARLYTFLCESGCESNTLAKVADNALWGMSACASTCVCQMRSVDAKVVSTSDLMMLFGVDDVFHF